MGNDRRTAYTQMVIKQALYKLLKKDILSHITVKGICEEAGINRATFYRNYEDIYALFEALEREMVEAAFPNGTIPQSLEKLLGVISDNQVFYKEFLRYHLESYYIKQVVETMENELAQQLKADRDFNEQEYEISFRYAFYGIVGVLKDWVDAGCSPITKEFAPILMTIVQKQFLGHLI